MSTSGLFTLSIAPRGKKLLLLFMASPPAAMAPCSAALASSNGKSVCRAARTRARAAYSALHSATRATGAAFMTTCVVHDQSGFANCNAVAQISQQHWSGRWPDFLQTPPRVAPANARFLPLIIRFPWAISLHFSCLAACFNLVMLVHVAAWLATRAPARPRNTRRALELARAARHLAASSSSRGASAARLPAALPRAAVYLPPPCRLRPAPHRTRSRRDPVAAATVPARLHYRRV